MSSARRCFCQLTALISPVILRSPVYTACTCWAECIVFIYMWLPVSKKLYQRNPEHLANRVEVSGLFWHFVDLVWIFVFPLFICSKPMNNPPDISQDPKRIRGIRARHPKARQRLSDGGRAPAHVYRDHGRAIIRPFRYATRPTLPLPCWWPRSRQVAVAAVFMHLAAEKRLIYRILIFTGFFVMGLFWLILLAWYDFPIFR